MSKIPENPVYEDTVYQIDISDPLKGGVAVFDGEGEASNGFLNAGVQQVTNRTAYLKVTLDNHIGSGGAAHSVVTNASNGFMSSVDKTKLDGITPGAQPNAVTSVAGRTGAVTLTSSDVGLGNVNNTADSAKPVSTAQQTALNLKANLASPTFTGTPLAPTATSGTNTTQIATTAFVTAAVAGGGGGAVTSVAGRTGAVVLTSADVGLANVDNTSDVNKPVSTAQQTALNLKANLASPALTGTPTAPTATAGTNTTQIATTAFVLANATSSAQQFLNIQDQKTQGTNGGSSVSLTYTNRDLNTVVTNQISGASLAAGTGTITLPAGTYYTEATSPMRVGALGRIRLWNSTDSTTIILGTNEFSGNTTVQYRAGLAGQFTLTAPKSLNIQYFSGGVQAATGLGTPITSASDVEIYSEIRIWKIA